MNIKLHCCQWSTLLLCSNHYRHYFGLGIHFLLLAKMLFGLAGAVLIQLACPKMKLKTLRHTLPSRSGIWGTCCRRLLREVVGQKFVVSSFTIGHAVVFTFATPPNDGQVSSDSNSVWTSAHVVNVHSVSLIWISRNSKCHAVHLWMDILNYLIWWNH